MRGPTECAGSAEPLKEATKDPGIIGNRHAEYRTRLLMPLYLLLFSRWSDTPWPRHCSQAPRAGGGLTSPAGNDRRPPAFLLGSWRQAGFLSLSSGATLAIGTRDKIKASFQFECFLPSLKGQNAGRFLNFMVSHNLSTRNLNKHVKIPGRIRRLLNGWGHSTWAWPLFTSSTCAHSNQKP